MISCFNLRVKQFADQFCKLIGGFRLATSSLISRQTGEENGGMQQPINLATDQAW